ncbi:hypothetical protein PaG_06034 [Moesziomyces aphidis]|uniref:LSM2-LSM8 complex subunit LSM8 n=1 Tax=Moesziomyces aphidis TaxID=84754 RepID=W3VH40_MOEAP|nr:hypothetical protein PaG_06034 [Moesziomyces aphidis]
MSLSTLAPLSSAPPTPPAVIYTSNTDTARPQHRPLLLARGSNVLGSALDRGDGRVIVGTLRGSDAVGSIILAASVERIFSPDEGVEEVPLGLYILRGDAICLVGLVDVEKDKAIDLATLMAEPIPETRHVPGTLSTRTAIFNLESALRALRMHSHAALIVQRSSRARNRMEVPTRTTSERQVDLPGYQASRFPTQLSRAELAQATTAVEKDWYT